MSYLDDVNKILGGKKDTATKLDKPKPQVKILIVEDDPSLSEMYSYKFIHEGFDVTTAPDGQKGLETAISFMPDIILLDLMMPIMDGRQMLRKLREIPKFKKLPVIVVTNAGDIESMKETQRYENANEFLIKSNVSIDDVVKKVKDWTNLV
ncbi:MAG TPA: response regulator transcription factor [Candidatus Limnocylindrales bacterium]|nr:response regulator transcription factor [Candidatus Limnocylindrales bacterium]